MNFSAKEDIAAPADYVFGAITDFAAFERSALRRGAEVQRIDTLRVPGPGMQWAASLVMRGRPRDVALELVTMDRPNGILFELQSGAIGGTFRVDLVPLSRGRTRMSVALDLAATTLSARLMMQSLKLAQTKLSKRFRERVAAFAEDAEERYKWCG